jgi:hypothetical protein
MPTAQTPIAASYDEPYTYRRPTSRNPWPFSQHQYARLLVLRGRYEQAPDLRDQRAQQEPGAAWSDPDADSEDEHVARLADQGTFA